MQELTDLARFLNIPPAHLSTSGNLAVNNVVFSVAFEITGLRLLLIRLRTRLYTGVRINHAPAAPAAPASV